MLYLVLAFCVVPLFINFKDFGLSHDQTGIFILFEEILINGNKNPADIPLVDKRIISANKSKASLYKDLFYSGNERYHSNFRIFNIVENIIPKQNSFLTLLTT